MLSVLLLIKIYKQLYCKKHNASMLTLHNLLYLFILQLAV